MSSRNESFQYKKQYSPKEGFSKNTQIKKVNATKLASKYVNIDVNGKLFPSWILRNFKSYLLPKIITAAGEDPCKQVKKEISQKQELRKYQQFISEYLNAESPYKGILLYHGLGSGKTAAAINLYNALYNYNDKWNMFVLLKTSLKGSWLAEIEKRYAGYKAGATQGVPATKVFQRIRERHGWN